MMSEPPGGRIEGRVHIFPLRVYYEDTDFSGFVYHAGYLRFMERGRSEFLRMSGIGHQQLLNAADPMFWTVRKIAITYLRPAHIEDALQVHSGVAALSGARMLLDQWMTRGAERLTEAVVEVCLISAAGRPRRIPDAIRKAMEFYIRTQDNPAIHMEG